MEVHVFLSFSFMEILFSNEMLMLSHSYEVMLRKLLGKHDLKAEILTWLLTQVAINKQNEQGS